MQWSTVWRFARICSRVKPPLALPLSIVSRPASSVLSPPKCVLTKRKPLAIASSTGWKIFGLKSSRAFNCARTTGGVTVVPICGHTLSGLPALNLTNQR